MQRQAATGREEARRGEQGAILLVLVIGVVVMGILLGQASQAWSTITLREREAEFFSRSSQIVDAIRRFQTDQGRLPNTMQELLEPGPNGNSRYLRKPWKDPLSQGDWVLLWLAPDGSSLFRSDGRPSASGSFGLTPGGAGANGNQAAAINLSQLSVPLGSPGYDADKNRSLLDAYKKSTEGRIGERTQNAASKAFGFNPDVNLGNFDTGSNLLNSPGIGPIAGVATSYDGTPFMEWKGRSDYSGFEVSIFSDEADRKGVQNPGTAPKRNLWEQPGIPIPGPDTQEGRNLRNTNTGNLQGGKKPNKNR